MRRAVIVGGGPIGLLAAALLAPRRIACTIIDARPPEQASADPRLLALSRGSWQILAPLFGRSLPRRAPIREVHVSSAGDFGATCIAAADFGFDELGATVLYGELVAALAAVVGGQSAIEVRRPLAATEIRQRPDHVEVLLADGSAVTGELAVLAEGHAPAPAGAAAGTLASSAGPWALLADLRVVPAGDDLSAGAAFERFTREGPLALLPTPRAASGGSGRGLSLVWCMAQAQAQRRLRLAETALLAELQAALGVRIGRPTAIANPVATALPRQRLERVRRHRVVALGNAAQTLHPVAGQGFNLGVRDCATLAEELAAGDDAAAALDRYARRRAADRATLGLLTDALPAVFASRLAPLAVARGLGLALLDAMPPLRRRFAHLLMFGVRS
jgi:2-octaprenyl-6-methoxyphenol hydroxylase